MKSNIFKHFIGLIIILFFHLHLTGCASIGPTKPNIPFSGNLYPYVLKELAEKNSLLVQELGKLPELQKEISKEEVGALENLVRLYDGNQDSFNKAFEQMYQIGKPEVRKYCAPLQALFWLAEDNELGNDNDLLSDYSLEELLKMAWKNDPLSHRLISDNQIKEIIDGIEDKNIRKLYLDDLQNGLTYDRLQHSFVSDYNRSKRTNILIFSNKAAKTIKDNLLNRNTQRWDNPYQIIDRLNSPQLFEYWFAHNFTYNWNRFFITTMTAYPQSAERSIMTKKGICFDAAYLAYKCLKQAGYDVTGLNVYFGCRTRMGAIMHSVCIIIKKDLNTIVYYKLADTNSPGFISGPYNSIKEIAEYVARMNGVWLGRYFTGMPHYDYSLFE